MASPSKPSREKSFMSLNTIISDVTERIQTRSEQTRKAYLDTMRAAAQDGPRRAHLSCGNQAHAYAAMGADKEALLAGRSANIGIVTAYNDMLSAHQPFEQFPQVIKAAAQRLGGTAQVAGGLTGDVRRGHPRSNWDGTVAFFA